MPTPTLPEALRLAADLTEQIGWTDGITWTGTREIHLHMSYGRPDPTDAIVERGATLIKAAVRIHTWQMPTGLLVTIFGERRPVDAEAA
mgnify:CR=1 FL=1